MIKRNPSLTDQVKAHIKSQILADAYQDDRIPSEFDLANELGVSRTTVRDALSRLENEGIIFRKQGAGTFVNPPGLQVRSRLDEIWSYEAALQAHGYVPSTQVLDSQLTTGDPKTKELHIGPEDSVLIARKLFLEDTEPVIMAINMIPANLIEKPYTDGDLIMPVFEFLAEFCGQHLSYFLSEIVPLVGTGEIARFLHLKEGTPLISLVEVGYNEENEPILKAYSYFRDDLLRLGLIRRKI